MIHPRICKSLRIMLAFCVGIVFSSRKVAAQSASPLQGKDLFTAAFNELASAKEVGTIKAQAAYYSLVEAIVMMPPQDISAGIQVIDQQLDSTPESEDRLAKFDAAYLLVVISTRPDGSTLLASQFDRLASMLNDSSHALSAPAVLALEHLALGRPDLVIPILETGLKAPELNSRTDLGPGIATILLRTNPNQDVTRNVVLYMRRPDLTDNELIDMIIGINNSSVILDALTAELVRCLDSRNDIIKGRAFKGILRSSPEARSAARSRIERMANDPSESAHIRQIAAEALAGGVTENPDGNK